MTTSGDTGRRGEELAAAWLEGKGFRIAERNFRCKAGEIDIVAVERPFLCFVEVKARSGAGVGPPEAAVSPGKRARLVRAAHFYVACKRLAGVPYRYDVVGVRLDSDPPVFTLLRDAFDETPRGGPR